MSSSSSRLGARLFALGLAVLGCLLAVAPRVEAAKAAYEIKIATLAPEGSTWMKIMTALDADIRTETQNAVGLKFYPGGIQGGEDVVLRKIRTGQLHGAGFTGVGLGEIAPSLRVMELPFLFRDEHEVEVVHAKLDPLFEQKLNEGGYTLLGWAEVGFIYLYSKDAIGNPEQLKSAKVWLWEGDPLAETFLKTAGVSPVPLDVTDVMTSLQTGLVSAVYVSPLACIALQWFTRVKYVTDLPLTHGLGAVVVTNDAWGKVPAQYQAKVRELCQKRFAELREATKADNAKSADVITQSGVQKVTLPAEQAQAFRGLGGQVEQALVGRLYDQALLDQVHQELNAMRAAGK
ncbi:MAG: TRAP transporter substrate-binding protein DctP [Candidatus Eisenbacteria bacterium]